MGDKAEAVDLVTRAPCDHMCCLDRCSQAAPGCPPAGRCSSTAGVHPAGSMPPANHWQPSPTCCPTTPLGLRLVGCQDDCAGTLGHSQPLRQHLILRRHTLPAGGQSAAGVTAWGSQKLQPLINRSVRCRSGMQARSRSWEQCTTCITDMKTASSGLWVPALCCGPL